MLGQHPLDLDRATRPFEGARELDEKPVADRLDLAPAVLREDRAEQPPMHLEQVERERLVALGERREADHVREHDRGQPPLPGSLRRHGFGPNSTARAQGPNARCTAPPTRGRGGRGSPAATFEEPVTAVAVVEPARRQALKGVSVPISFCARLPPRPSPRNEMCGSSVARLITNRSSNASRACKLPK